MFVSRRMAGGAAGWIRTNILLVGSARADRATLAPAEGIEPSKDRLTAGCLTIRLRWNQRSPLSSLSRGARGAIVWRQVVIERAPRVRDACSRLRRPLPAPSSSLRSCTSCTRAVRFRVQESNLCFWIQRPASCQLDDPGMETRAGRIGRSGGTRTLTNPLKRRVRSPLRYGPKCIVRANDAVGREGLEPSPLGLKARCSSVELASRARTIVFDSGRQRLDT